MNAFNRVEQAATFSRKILFVQKRIESALETWEDAFYNDTTIQIRIPEPLLPYAQGYLYPKGYRFRVIEGGIEIEPRWVGTPRVANQSEIPDFYLWVHTDSTGLPVGLEGPNGPTNYVEIHNPRAYLGEVVKGLSYVYVEGIPQDQNRPPSRDVSFHSRKTTQTGFKVDYRKVTP